MAYDEFLGRTDTFEDTVWPPLIEHLAVALGLPDIPGELPPLWHWMLFQEWRGPNQLGEDGHPRRGGFLPAAEDLPRRMWAGGRVRFGAPLRAGDPVTRTRRIAAIEEKQGGSGKLLFVTVAHEVTGPSGVAVSEEQDIVYRGLGGAAVKPAPAAPPPPEGALVHRLTPDAVLLFRYSALTGNGHRIHYDLDYVTHVEGYPGLVVHGPLQATLLALHAQTAAGGARLAGIAYRARRPAFAGHELTLVGARDGARVLLSSRDDGGAICMEAEATFA
jgi:3-methylfumaryl-CoA hydratase